LAGPPLTALSHCIAYLGLLLNVIVMYTQGSSLTAGHDSKKPTQPKFAGNIIGLGLL